jgi:hypothetical protein
MQPEIALARAELGELAGELIEQRHPTEPFGVYLLGPEEPGAELGRHLERAVFLETFGNTGQLLASEYGTYEAASVFVVVIDHRRLLPSGMMRVIVPSNAGFKSLHDIPRHWGEPVEKVMARVDRAWEPARLWDLATLAVTPDYRGESALGLVTMALVQALTMAGQRAGVQRWVGILDLPVLRMLQWRVGRPFQAFPGVEPRSYLGSAASVAVWGDRALWDAQLRTADPVMHDLLFGGAGLEAVLSTPDWDDAAALVNGVSHRSSLEHF